MGREAYNFEEALQTIGALLKTRGYSIEIVAMGGGALALLGLISRPTKDIDLLAVVEQGRFIKADPMPKPLVEARDDVALSLGLPSDWLNAGPTSIMDLGLPVGLSDRLITRYYQGLTVHLVGRLDQVFFKFYAAVDRGPRSKHVSDLEMLKPTFGELRAAFTWACSHDPSKGFAEMGRQTLAYFGVDEFDGAQ